MHRALHLAKKGLNSTHPNPRVGCVLVKDNRIIGEGWHRRAGLAHAESLALESAQDSVQGATAYVNLEPCAHQGKTPPCCQALIAAGIKRVVLSLSDPDARVAGRGIEQMRAAGITVDIGLCAREARLLNAGFISRHTRTRPWIRIKLATSLDGKTALRNGRSQWITGEEARADVHRWRARCDCILTGSGTIEQDNPSLDARPSDFALPAQDQPTRAVIDSGNTLTTDAKLFKIAGKIILFNRQADAKKYAHLPDVTLQEIPATESGKLDLTQVMHQLAAREINEVQVEAGAGLCGALLQCQLVDELLIYRAASVIGSGGRDLFDTLPIDNMDQCISFKLQDLCILGQDIRTVFYPQYDRRPH